jgi:hypothetical protein
MQMSETMDNEYKYFYEKKGFGPAVHPHMVPHQSLEKYVGKLPNQLLTYWEQYGWSGYANGLFWTVDPDEYHPVLDAWIGDTTFVQNEKHYIIARSAFGKLFLWGEMSGPNLTIDAVSGMIFPSDRSEEIQTGEGDFLSRRFFANQKKTSLDELDPLERPLFDRAFKMYGPLAPDEMYGFEPALALGGKPELANIRKVKAVEHLVLLAQLGERKIMRDIVKDAKAHGLM